MLRRNREHGKIQLWQKDRMFWDMRAYELTLETGVEFFVY